MAKKDKVSLRSGTAPKAKAPRKPQATTLYPKYSLVEALKIAESIRDNNAGQPYNRVDLAASLETSPESSSFRILITASSKYGLTEGGYQAERISLTELGRSIVSPTNDEERAAGLLRALYNVEFYSRFSASIRTIAFRGRISYLTRWSGSLRFRQGTANSATHC